MNFHRIHFVNKHTLKSAASVGGIFGLCLGASTISLIEVIYFVIIRICGRIIFQTMPKRKNHRPTIKSKQLDPNAGKMMINPYKRRIFDHDSNYSKRYLE